MTQALNDYLLVLRRWWRVLLVFPLLAVSVTALHFALKPAEFSAESLLFVATPRDDEQSYYVGDDYSRKRLDTILVLSRSPAIAERVNNDLGLGSDPQAMVGRVQLSSVLGTVLLKLTTAGSTPQQAVEVGDAYIEELRRSVAALESVSGGLVSRIELVPVQAPTVRDHAGMFPTWMVLGATGVLGLVAGALAVVVVALLDGRIRRPEHAAEAVDAPVLARFDSPRESVAVLGRPPDSEAGRQLRTALDRLGIVGSRIIMLASAERGAGRTGVALSTARVLADRGSDVALVDFDSRCSALAATLALEDGDTVAGIVGGPPNERPSRSPMTFSRRPNWCGVKVIPFGRRGQDDGTTVDHPGVGPLLKALRSTYDWVIIDTPAASEFSDAARLARHADAVVLVVRAGRTLFDDLRAVSEQLRLAGGQLAGVVFVDKLVRHREARSDNGPRSPSPQPEPVGHPISSATRTSTQWGDRGGLS
ncbi:polysaccharide biosynthesis tyrosine autokinase [Mycobacterium sp. ACS4331]|uniref:polysaccharide biosynthesis tyrosine autokinase n=1 Tax=Mycobacterium sp. ACS4331 TaxID=1834121 RepID=UPI00080102CC|nr:polysaccharide biosynthesis tyrosine autokinase [Mycobacterium sp. ACS4331]OBF16543.1 hypothetical protein A5727_13465 [Mycobacterium sp. ACS4331]